MAHQIYVICTKCKRRMFKNFGTKTFCSDCGTELPEVKKLETCIDCDKTIHDD